MTNRNRFWRQTFTVLTFVFLMLVLWSLFNFSRSSDIKEIPISQLADEVAAKQVKEVTVDGDKITATLKDGTKQVAIKETSQGLKDYGITPEHVIINVRSGTSGAVWTTVLSIFVPFLLLGLFLFFIARQARSGNMQAMSFGKTTARMYAGKKPVSFKDVAGLKHVKQELEEIVEFLKHPAKFRALGAEIPHGVLLVGPAGVGKTLLAKAVAGEAGVPFFSISASEFVEMFVGVGASRVRDLFTKAKKSAPTVIFIDELDAVGRQRGTGLGGSHDEREQTLNQILVEMDGFETDTRVIIMAATNRPDVLDPALLRPGRFDRRVSLLLPDKKERKEILQIHAKNKPLSKEAKLDRIASATAGLSGADLKNIVNEAAIFAARNNRKIIVQKDLEESIEKVMLGPEKKSRLLSDKE